MARKTTNWTRSTAGTRSSWNEAAARDFVEQLQSSGETVAAFARERGLNAWTLYEWRRRLGVRPPQRLSTMHQPGAQVAVPTHSAFLPVRVTAQPTPPVASAEPLEVVLAGGRRVRVPSNFDDAALRRLVSVLEEVS